MSYQITINELNHTYSKNAYKGDNPNIIGKPDRDLFNRNEAYEIISIINQISKDFEIDNLKDCLEIEEIIKEDLPKYIHKRIEVIEWIENFIISKELKKKADEYYDLIINSSNKTKTFNEVIEKLEILKYKNQIYISDEHKKIICLHLEHRLLPKNMVRTSAENSKHYTEMIEMIRNLLKGKYI